MKYKRIINSETLIGIDEFNEIVIYNIENKNVVKTGILRKCIHMQSILLIIYITLKIILFITVKIIVYLRLSENFCLYGIQKQDGKEKI